MRGHQQSEDLCGLHRSVSLPFIHNRNPASNSEASGRTKFEWEGCKGVTPPVYPAALRPSQDASMTYQVSLARLDFGWARRLLVGGDAQLNSGPRHASHDVAASTLRFCP